MQELKGGCERSTISNAIKPQTSSFALQRARAIHEIDRVETFSMGNLNSELNAEMEAVVALYAAKLEAVMEISTSFRLSIVSFSVAFPSIYTQPFVTDTPGKR